MLTQCLPLLEADVGLERYELGVVEGVLAPGIVVVRFLAGGHPVGVRGRQVAGGRQLGVGVLLVIVEGVDGGVGVPGRRDARDRLRLVRDLGRAVEADQQPGDKADRAELQKRMSWTRG